MANKMIYAKDLKSNSIIFINNTAVMIKFVEVGPKSVYAIRLLMARRSLFAKMML
jgi:hypothetical protein